MNGIKTEPGLIGVKTEPEVPLCAGVKSEPALPILASKPEPEAEEHREDFQRKNNDNLSHNLPWPAVPGFGPHLLSQIERLVNRENMGRVDQFNAALAMRFIHDSTQGQVLQIVRKMSRRQQLQRQSNCLNTLMSVCKLR